MYLYMYLFCKSIDWFPYDTGPYRKYFRTEFNTSLDQRNF